MRVPNPFKGVDNPREVWAWGMFDLANQSFTLLINTLLFSVFLTQVLLGGAKEGPFVWSLFGSISMLIVVLLSPVLGTLADRRRCKKRALVVTGVACTLLTCALALLPAAGPGGSLWLPIALAALVYMPANIMFNLGENLLAAFLPEISRRDNIGQVSAIGWTMGYVGALVLLVCVIVLIPLLGINGTQDWRPLLLFAGVWFGLNMIPTMLYLKERGTPPADSAASTTRARSAIGQSLAGLARSARDIFRFRDLMVLLAGFLVYAMGVQTIVFFAGTIARDDFGFKDTELVVFAGVLALVAAVSSTITGCFQDRIGHKATILSILGIWLLTALGMAVIVQLHSAGFAPKWMIWLLGIGIGLGLGGIGTATRALVGVFTPQCRTGEFFALWGLTYKLAAVIGLPIYGAVRTWTGSLAANVVLMVFFLVGGLIITAVSVHRGIEAAEREDRKAQSSDNETASGLAHDDDTDA